MQNIEKVIWVKFIISIGFTIKYRYKVLRIV